MPKYKTTYTKSTFKRDPDSDSRHWVQSYTPYQETYKFTAEHLEEAQHKSKIQRQIINARRTTFFQGKRIFLHYTTANTTIDEIVEL